MTTKEKGRQFPPQDRLYPNLWGEIDTVKLRFTDTRLTRTVCFVPGERKPLHLFKFNPLYTDTPLIRTLSMAPLAWLTGFGRTQVMFPRERERERDGDSFHALRFPRWKWMFIKPLCEFFSRPSLPCLPSRAAHAYLLGASLHGGQCLMVLGSHYVTLITLLLYFGFQRCLWILCTSVIDESDSLRRSSYFLGRKRTATATWFPWHRNSEINARLNSGIRIAYKMGLTREFAWYSTINEKLRRKSNLSGRERKLSEVIKRKEHIIYGSHINKDTSVTMTNVTVSFLSLIDAPWCWMFLPR